MKMYKKSDLKLINGMIVSETGDVITVDEQIVEQANELETLYQKAKYIEKQPSATPMPSLDGFKRKSYDDNGNIFFRAVTPILDEKTEEAMRMMDEIDDANTAERANEMLNGFNKLIKFASNDYVVDCGYTFAQPFDMVFLGSILELTREDIINVIAFANGMSEEIACDDCDLKDECPDAEE